MEVIRVPIGYSLVIRLQVTTLLIERLARVGGVDYDTVSASPSHQISEMTS
jgi:hypothetical protein